MKYELEQHPNGGYYIVNSNNPFDIVASNIPGYDAIAMVNLVQGMPFNAAKLAVHNYYPQYHD